MIFMKGAIGRMKALKLLKKVWSDFHLASGADAKGKVRQLYEIVQLALRCQFTPDEYYSYRFFDKKTTYSDMLNYLPNYHAVKYFHPAMSDPELSVVFSNKLLFNAYFGYYGLPVTNIYAFFLEDTDYSSDGFLLKTEKELESLLSQKRPGALVIKPAGGSRGQNVTIFNRLEFNADKILFFCSNGKKADLKRVAQIARQASGGKLAPGALIEEKLDQHDLLNRINSSSVNTIRIVTQLKKDGTAFSCFAVLRLGREGSDVDNISKGGLFVRINMDTGELGEGSLYTKFNAGCFTEHPDSGVKFSGLKIPCWIDVKRLCVRAAELTPFCRSIGWDVAVTPEGPVLIEGNMFWAVDLQARSGGFLQPDVREALVAYGLTFPEGRLPGMSVTELYKAVKFWSGSV